MKRTREYATRIERRELGMNGLALMGYYRSTKVQHPLETHTHPNRIEFVIMLKGEESYSIDNREYLLSPGQVFVAPESMPHRSGGRGYQAIGEFIWFQLDMRTKGDFLGLGAEMAGELKATLRSLKRSGSYMLNADKEVRELAVKSFRAFHEKSHEIYAGAIFVSMLSRLLLVLPGEATTSNRIAKALDYIRDNIEDTLPLQTLAEHCGLSLSGFKHGFKAETGDSPRSYINRRKIEHAKMLLRRGSSVTAVAMKLQFAGADYFATMFRRYTGVSPSAFKKSSAHMGEDATFS